MTSGQQGPRNLESYGTRRLIIQYISQNGNQTSREELTDYVMKTRNLQFRSAVKYHIESLIRNGDMVEEDDFLKLVSPIKPSPVESWRLVGIPLGTAFVLMSLVEGSLVFTVSSVIFLAYSLAITVEEVAYYYRLRVKAPFQALFKKLFQWNN